MWIESFLRYIQYEKAFSSHTVLSYKNDLFSFREFVEQRQADFVARTVDARLIRFYIVKLVDDGISPRTIARKISTLRSFFRYLVKEGEVSVNPVVGVQLPKTTKKLPSFLKTREMDILLDQMDYGEGFRAVRDRLILSMFYETGMRRAELIGLRDEDVDLCQKSIKVYGKRRKQRIIPIGGELAQQIEAYLEARTQSLGEKKTGALLVKEDGGPLYPVLVYRVVTHYLEAVSTLTKCSPHVLRHTFASAMLNNGAQLNSVKELLGHSSIASTEVYTHITFEELKHNYKQAHPRADKKGGHYGT